MPVGAELPEQFLQIGAGGDIILQGCLQPDQPLQGPLPLGVSLPDRAVDLDHLGRAVLAGINPLQPLVGDPLFRIPADQLPVFPDRHPVVPGRLVIPGNLLPDIQNLPGEVGGDFFQGSSQNYDRFPGTIPPFQETGQLAVPGYPVGMIGDILPEILLLSRLEFETGGYFNHSDLPRGLIIQPADKKKGGYCSRSVQSVNTLSPTINRFSTGYAHFFRGGFRLNLSQDSDGLYRSDSSERPKKRENPPKRQQPGGDKTEAAIIPCGKGWTSGG